MGEAESSSTPRSTAEPQLKAAKDKNCPFCGQAFTSSSLGRHLDLYIRPKNPKAPDGIHVVDEIRKLRGGITRRQAKGSVSTPRRDDSGTSTPANKKRVASEDSSMAVQSPDDDDDESLQVGKTRGHHFKDVSWGGGSGSRPSRLATKTPDPRRHASRHMRKADLDQRQKTGDEAEIASATEMALRELLKSVREANAKASGAGLFDFDPYTQNFPSLCLHILPAPSTLFSPTPFPTAESWSISPPGQKQFEALNKQVRERLLAHQRQRQINQVYPSGAQAAAPSTTSSPLPTPPLFDHDPQRLFGHIADAFHHWTQHSDKTRQEYWQIEILRCYARAHDRRREAEVQLENARREIDYLKANRWTAGAPDLSPISINLGADTARELAKHGMDYRNWDYDRLIDKWRTAIRENKVSVAGLAAQKPLPGEGSSRSCSMASLPPQFATVNQPRQGSPIKVETSMPFSAPPTLNGDDQVDAEGDDDDEELDLTPHTIDDEDPMHHMHQVQRQSVHQSQHHHPTPLQPTPQHPSQQFQSHMQPTQHLTQAQIAQAQAQAQAWAAARQHMNQSRQDFRPHQQQHQLSPHLQHVSSAESSRRESLAMMDPHAAMNQNTMNSIGASMGMSGGMDSLDNHQDQFLRMDMGMPTGFVGSNDGGVSMG
ncbi:hypothetical protein P3342_012426 [Pyrenophora teres f. teres]|nr:hypothetical protein HRS9139_09110 [Pyrenophora teres f. teres]KAE8825102.1 hypothetical protein HRS9122_10201 [Pyrenophora teres f. teres]KAE8827133.1 hypothetical protein PTNB85_08486 [Pyrenophora teres f. teres]KAK1911943.1 hypothetical protein P3342_012426 [Pyrenophora teres f. teres]CAA9966191.1 PAT1 domain containing protein [Pyrenophora teres f. maculata]